jgi:hypothetical protein
VVPINPDKPDINKIIFHDENIWRSPEPQQIKAKCGQDCQLKFKSLRFIPEQTDNGISGRREARIGLKVEMECAIVLV